jgi:phosphoglycerate dehydrogenase-like enzyme
MAEPFRIGYTNDFLTPDGRVGWGDIGLARYDDVPNIEWSFLPVPEPVLTAENAGDYDALAVLAPRVTADLVDHAPRLAVVARFGVGYDSVDLDACTRNGIAVTITPDGVRRPMAATGMAFMLALSHRILDKDRITRKGEWSSKLDYMGYQVTGATLGFVGLGNIARDMLHLASPWDMRQIAYDPYISREQAESIGVELVDLDTLMRESDYLVVLCKLTDETFHLIDAERLALMKPTAFLINIARGPIVDEASLYESLRYHRIQGAALDVFEKEPPDPDNPLFQLSNVIVAPHALGWTSEAAMGIGSGVIDAILDIREGRVPAHVVNREVIDTPRFQEKLTAFRERLES